MVVSRYRFVRVRPACVRRNFGARRSCSRLLDRVANHRKQESKSRTTTKCANRREQPLTRTQASAHKNVALLAHQYVQAVSDPNTIRHHVIRALIQKVGCVPRHQRGPNISATEKDPLLPGIRNTPPSNGVAGNCCENEH